MVKLSRLTFWLYLCLLIIGLVFIVNSSVVDAYRDFANQWVYLIRQSVWVSLSFASYLFISRFPLPKLYVMAKTFYFVCIGLLLLVLIPGIGTHVSGAQRWFSLGFFNLQPSEFIKIILVIFLPYITYIQKIDFKKFAFYGGLPILLTLMQPDLGTALVITLVVLGLFIIQGYSFKTLLLFLPGLIGILLIYIIVSPYRMERVKTFFGKHSDSLGNYYQTHQSLIAIGRGGLTGVGFGQSRQKYNFLPESSTDSIFSIIAEETGLWGTSLLLLLFISLISVAIKISGQTKNIMYSQSAAGVGILIAAQSLLNLGAITGLLPLTGVPLPFISYGGSSLLNFSLCLGLLTAISKS